jgi:hypothetical protein
VFMEVGSRTFPQKRRGACELGYVPCSSYTLKLIELLLSYRASSKCMSDSYSYVLLIVTNTTRMQTEEVHDFQLLTLTQHAMICIKTSSPQKWVATNKLSSLKRT